MEAEAMVVAQVASSTRNLASFPDSFETVYYKVLQLGFMTFLRSLSEQNLWRVTLR